MIYNYFSNCKFTYDPWGKNNNNKSQPDCCSSKNKSKFNIFNKDKCLSKIDLKFNIFRNQKKGMKNFFNQKNYFLFLFLMIIISIWVVGGLYTIKEAEKGVVLRFGQYHHLVQPGLNWKPIFIDVVIPVNVESVRELAASGMMLTSDENVVRVEMNVQYRVTHPKNYLFNVVNADDSLRQATDSALRGVIGKYNMDRILTEGRTVVRIDTRRILEKTIYPYNMGITLLDVNFQTARPPEEVKASFDDAIAARENEQQYIREAEAYANEVQPRANGQAQRILEEGRAYKSKTVLEAQGEVQRFVKILPEYRSAPKITRDRLYINTMERVLSNTKKILINSKNAQSLLLFPSDFIDHMQNKRNGDSTDFGKFSDDLNINKPYRKIIDDSNTKETTQSKSGHCVSNHNKIVNSIEPEEKVLAQRKVNTQRVDFLRKGRE